MQIEQQQDVYEVCVRCEVPFHQLHLDFHQLLGFNTRRSLDTKIIVYAHIIRVVCIMRMYVCTSYYMHVWVVVLQQHVVWCRKPYAQTFSVNK